MTAVGGPGDPSDSLLPDAPSRPRRIAFLAGSIWLATLCIGIATVWSAVATDSLQMAYGVTMTPDQELVFRAIIIAFFAVSIGYVSVGGLLAGRAGAGRIAALLLASGALFALVPFGYLVGGGLASREPGSTVFAALWVLGPVAIGPALATILPGLAIAFPDGHLPSRRWRLPVGIAACIVGVGTFLQLVRPDALVGGPAGGPASGPRNPFGIEALPAAIGSVTDIAFAVGILVFILLGIVAVIVRYRRGDAIERQQQRWFQAAVSLAALPLALSLLPLSSLPGVGGPTMVLISAIGLSLVPIAVGIAVTRYRLYEIDHLISRTLVYVPLTALLAGLYAATVTLLQRLFQSLTGDRSDAAIIISTLILASVFTPLRKWLEGIVERRFKPAPSAIAAAPTADWAAGPPGWEARLAAIELRLVRIELEGSAAHEHAEG